MILKSITGICVLAALRWKRLQVHLQKVAHMNKQHPIHGKDDTACAWLCLHAGHMSRHDEREIELALENLNCQKPKQVPFINMIARVK